MNTAPVRVGILAPMPNELRPVVALLRLRRTGDLHGLPLYTGVAGTTEVVATRTGIGPRLAEEAAERLLQSTELTRIVVTGIAGGIAPVTGVGDLVVPQIALDAATGERFPADVPPPVRAKGVVRTAGEESYELTAQELTRLRESGVHALDMETAAIARVCRRHGVPWTAFRAVSDMAGDESVGPVVMTLVHPDGSPRIGAALRFLLTRPWRIPRMVRLGREADGAARTAARAAVQLVTADGAGPVSRASR
jgi:adenosylhomocysteine nucleosidase